MTQVSALDKATLRESAKRLRTRLQDHMGLEAAEKVADHVAGFFASEISEKLFGLYMPTGSELDARLTAHRLDRLSAALALPSVTAKNAPLIFRRWGPGDPLVAAAYGIKEPEAEAPEVVPDIILAPLLAFDGACNRLGYGGGFYDRTLAAHPHVRAFGLAFAAQFVDKLPTLDTDIPLHGVITEEGVYIPGKGR